MICNNSHGVAFLKRLILFEKNSPFSKWKIEKNNFGHKLSKNGQQFNWITLKVRKQKEISKMKYLLTGDFSIRRSSIHRCIVVIWSKTHKYPMSHVPCPAHQFQVFYVYGKKIFKLVILSVVKQLVPLLQINWPNS